MSTWLYQLNAHDWSPETFRYEIWEGKSWRWGYGSKRGDAEFEVGDTLIFFHTPTGCSDPGFYGWAVLERHREEEAAARLGILKAQAKVWIQELVKAGALEKVKKSKPPRFRTVSQASRLL